MPSYRFHFVPDDGKGDVELHFHNDDDALAEARRALRKIIWTDGGGMLPSIEVIRHTGVVAGLVTAAPREPA